MPKHSLARRATRCDARRVFGRCGSLGSLSGGEVELARDLYATPDRPGDGTAVGVNVEHALYGLAVFPVRGEVKGSLDLYYSVRLALGSSRYLYSPSSRELMSSRIPVYSFANPYALEPGLSAVSGPKGHCRQHTM